MDPTPSKPDRLFWDKVEAARRMDPRRKTFAGVELFAQVKQRMRLGIRHECPDATPQEVEAELRRRLAINRRIENGQ